MTSALIGVTKRRQHTGKSLTPMVPRLQNPPLLFLLTPVGTPCKGWVAFFWQVGRASSILLGALVWSLHDLHDHCGWWHHSPSCGFKHFFGKSFCQEILPIKGLPHNIHLSCLSFPMTWNAWKNMSAVKSCTEQRLAVIPWFLLFPLSVGPTFLKAEQCHHWV